MALEECAAEAEAEAAKHAPVRILPIRMAADYALVACAKEMGEEKRFDAWLNFGYLSQVSA